MPTGTFAHLLIPGAALSLDISILLEGDDVFVDALPSSHRAASVSLGLGFLWELRDCAVPDLLRQLLPVIPQFAPIPMGLDAYLWLDLWCFVGRLLAASAEYPNARVVVSV